MTAAEFFTLFYGVPIMDMHLTNPNASVEHVTLETLCGASFANGEPTERSESAVADVVLDFVGGAV